jgi:hypothetical protein
VVERCARRGESWLLTAAVAGLLDLDRICLSELGRLDPREQRRVRDGLIAALTELFLCLERRGLTHRDLKASNILFSDWTMGSARAWLTDLDGLGRRSMSFRGRAQPLARLAASVLSYSSISRTDYARVLLAYLRRGGDVPRNWKHEFRRLQGLAVCYARRAAARKRHKLDGYNADALAWQPVAKR